ncbi:hypothetical protein STEG23_000472 [Scotinomys teguina]
MNFEGLSYLVLAKFDSDLLLSPACKFGCHAVSSRVNLIQLESLEGEDLNLENAPTILAYTKIYVACSLLVIDVQGSSSLSYEYCHKHCESIHTSAPLFSE